MKDDAMRQAMKDSGIGTPATRVAIIETLLRREYMVRQQKKLVPTEKGLALHSVVKNMAVANVEMTGRWEAELAKIERGEACADDFTHEIESYTREITAELLGCDKLFSHKDSGCQCPKCKQRHDAVLRKGRQMQQQGMWNASVQAGGRKVAYGCRRD